MRPFPPSLLLLLLPLALAVVNHHKRHVGHRREYLLCRDLVRDKLKWFKASAHDTTRSCDEAIAKVQYVNSINETGWAFVDIELSSSNTIPDYVQGYTAGFVEGRATRDLISMHHSNLFHDYCLGAEEYCERLRLYLRENLDWMRGQIEKHPEDTYWRQVNQTLNHVAGMIDGYEGKLMQRRNDHETAAHHIYMIQLQAEIWDLEAKLGRPKNLWKKRGHCSALVKLTDDDSNLLFTHITWDSLSSLLRVQRRIRFNLPSLPGSTYTYSGYPGTLASIDDFYLTSAKLAILETTNEVHDEGIYRMATAHSVPTWIRSQIATRLADSGEEWVNIFGRHNSGTYNNQWVVADYKLYTPGMQSLPPGLLYILEQMPGLTEYADKTEHLEKKRYWPGYNKPYFPSIFAHGGYNEMVAKFGDFFSYNSTARARIFARDQGAAQDIDTLRTLMRSNDYKNDPLSRCDRCSPPYNAELAIAARNDLNPADGSFPVGDFDILDLVATDAKITDVSLMKTLSFDSVAGPTHQSLPVFDWSTSQLKDKVRHEGQPTRFDFEPIRHIWKQNSLF